MKTLNDVLGAARDAASLLPFEQQAALVEAMLDAVNRSNNPVPELVNVLDAAIIAAKYFDDLPVVYEVGDRVMCPERKCDVPSSHVEPERHGLIVTGVTFAGNMCLPHYQRLSAVDIEQKMFIESAAQWFRPERRTLKKVGS